MTLVKRIGRNVKRLRQEHGWTQAELARRAAMHRIALAQTEAGRSISLKTLEKLAKALRVEPGRLLD